MVENLEEITSMGDRSLKSTSILLFFSWSLSLAVAYECTRTITSIYPDKDLIDKAGRCVGVFLVAKSNDIKYLGKWFNRFFLPSIIHVYFQMNNLAILTVCSWHVDAAFYRG